MFAMLGCRGRSVTRLLLLTTALFIFFLYLTLPKESAQFYAETTTRFSALSPVSPASPKSTSEESTPAPDVNPREATIQAARKHQVKKICKKVYSKWDEIMFMPEDFHHIFVNDEYKFLYCEVPKVACTNWKRIMLILSGALNATAPESLAASDVHSSLQEKYLQRLSSYSESEIQARLKTYYKFMFVREPLERLLSAYRNKFTMAYNDYFHVRYGSKIIKRFRSNATIEEISRGSDVTLNEFIQYVISLRKTRKEPFNSHWDNFYKLCFPCLVDYDFIGKFDSLNEDIHSVLKHLGVENQIHFPDKPTFNPSTSEILQSSFANISSEDIRELVKVYAIDYAMFGYKYPKL